MVTRRQMSTDALQARSAELDAIRLRRPLTAAEQAEADNLAHRAYMRVWHTIQHEHELRLVRIGQEAPR